jgi:hypothetical protein
VPERFKDPLGPFTMSMEVLASASPSQFGQPLFIAGTYPTIIP